jgi:hypothetical protein
LIQQSTSQATGPTFRAASPVTADWRTTSSDDHLVAAEAPQPYHLGQ